LRVEITLGIGDSTQVIHRAIQEIWLTILNYRRSYAQ
jgi:hypothetical protein